MLLIVKREAAFALTNRLSSPPTASEDNLSQPQLCTMKDQEADINVHHPPSRMTLVLDLVV